MTSADDPNTPLLHLVTPEAWAEAQIIGQVEPASLVDVGFVHLCHPEQLDGVIERHYLDLPELLVLTVDRDRLVDELRWEESHPGDWFPHLYGPLPVAAVTATADLSDVL